MFGEILICPYNKYTVTPCMFISARMRNRNNKYLELETNIWFGNFSNQHSTACSNHQIFLGKNIFRPNENLCLK